MADKNETERLVVDMNSRLKQEFKDKVESQGRSMTWQVTKWVDDYVKNGTEPKN